MDDFYNAIPLPLSINSGGRWINHMNGEIPEYVSPTTATTQYLMRGNVSLLVGWNDENATYDSHMVIPYDLFTFLCSVMPNGMYTIKPTKLYYTDVPGNASQVILLARTETKSVMDNEFKVKVSWQSKVVEVKKLRAFMGR